MAAAEQPTAAAAAAERAGARVLALAGRLGGPLLALDTSGPQASLALAVPGKAPGDAGLLLQQGSAAQLLPSEAVMPALAALLRRAQLEVTALAALVVGLGPGSFTGLRVGLASMKGLSLGSGVPLFGSSSLAMLAAGCGPQDTVVLRDARREHVYLGGYRTGPDGEVVPFLADARLPVAEAEAHVRAQHAARLPTDAEDAPGGRHPRPLHFVGEAAALLGLAPRPLPAPNATFLLLHAATRLLAEQPSGATGRVLLRQDLAALAALHPAYLFDFAPVG